MANFGRIATIYDFLKWSIFGGQLEKATKYFFYEIPSGSRILIIGGGTGKILENFNSSQHIKYLEVSDAMISKSKKVESKAKIEFVQADILEWKSEEKFDFIITPFVLDCFTEMHLNLIFTKLTPALDNGGEWIQTDFYPKNKWHKLLIKIMYRFFNLTTNLETKELAKFDTLFKKHKFICKRKACFYHSMVESKIYQKID